ncbi:MAG: hypothetical protein GTN82_27340 [Candidatus Aminicenantes bacterium]|nr:hypothetical protein [Candidatus Aminicenantes bacterium]
MKRKKAEKRRCFLSIILFGCVLVSMFSHLLALDPHKAITQYKLDIWQTERGLEQNTVLSIWQANDNYIWLGTMNGLVRFDGVRFKTFNTNNTKQLHDNIIRIIHEDREGNLWIGTEKGGLSCLKDGVFKSYSLEKEPKLKDIQAIFEDREGTLWIGTLDNGLVRFKKGKFIHYTEANGLLSNRVRAFYEDKDGTLWIGTSKGLSIQESSGKFIPYTGKNGPFNKYIISMCKTKDGKLCFGCDTGLYYLKDETFTYDRSNEYLPNLKIKCLYEDSHHNLWVGTEGDGLARIKNGRIETFSSVDGLASGYIFSIHEDNEGNIWIGTHKGGLHRLSNMLFTPYTTRQGLSHDSVYCITDDREGNILIGTENGLNRLKNGKLSLEWTKKKGLLSNNVTAVIEDSNGYLWIGTDAGLSRYKDEKLESFVDPDVDSNYIYRLWKEENGVTWILTLNGLKRFYNGKFTEVINRREVSNNYIASFCKGRDGSLWIGTHGKGLYRLKDKKRIAYTTREGLLHNAVESIYEDNKGRLYIGTRGGLSLMSNGKFKNCTTQNGLIDSYIYFIVEDKMKPDISGCLAEPEYHVLKKRNCLNLPKERSRKSNRSYSMSRME